MSRYRPAGTALAFALGIVAIFLAPRWVSDIDLRTAGIYLIAILGLNLVTGYTGQISLGHGAFMAVGGYTTAILVADAGLRDVWTIPLAGLAAGLAGFLVGIPALRLSGLYLAVATFGLAVATPQILKWDKLESLTGGTGGKDLFTENVTGEKVEFFGLSLTHTRATYYLVWAVAAVLLAAAWLLLRGAPGRAFRAVRDSEVAAASSGVNVAAYKTLAFAVSAFYAGVGGSLLVIGDKFVSPDGFPIDLSLRLVVGVVVAGLGSLWGLAAGAAFIQFLPDLAVKVSKAPGVPDTIYGAALVALVLLLPTGVAGGLRRLAGPLTTRLYTR